MTSSPLIWNIDEDIIVEIFVEDPSTGLGLTGQAGFLTLTIQRNSDSRYWNGSTWIVSLTSLSPTEVDSSTQRGRYTYTLSGTTGNTQADRYLVHCIINNPPTIQVDAYEVHVSRSLEVKIYESEPS